MLARVRPLGLVLLPLFFACAPDTYNPAWATRPYPAELHTTNVADIHVFRDGKEIRIVNSTARTYENFDLWLNQQYVRHVDRLGTGETITLSLWDFKNEFGDSFNAGGFFRVVDPTPLRLAEIQTGENEPMIGLVAIRSEEVRLPRPIE